MAKKKYTKEMILSAACEMALHNGLKKFSMRKLADKVGSSVMPIYENFGSKEELFDAINAFTNKLENYDTMSIYDRYTNLLYYGLKYTDYFLEMTQRERLPVNHRDTLCKTCYILKKDQRLMDVSDKEALRINTRIEVFLLGIIYSYKNIKTDKKLKQYKLLSSVLEEIIDSIIDGYIKYKK